MEKRGVKGLVAYLDDFLIICRTYQECLAALNMLIALLRSLGFSINYSKIEGPCQSLIFLGVNINTMSIPTLKLPEGRVSELLDLLHSFTTRKRASKRQLQQLCGKLNWACQVIRGGRTFLRRILDTTNKLNKSFHKILLTNSFHQDVTWWTNFMSTFNGKCIAINNKQLIHVEIDACNQGSGIFCEGDWQYTNFKYDWPEATDLHVNNKETLSVTLAARRWAPLWSNKQVIVHTDSVSAKSFINKGTCKNKLVMTALRELFWWSAQYNFEIKAVFLPGVLNIIADTVSRLHENKLHLLHSVLSASYQQPCTSTDLRLFWDSLPLHMSNSSLCHLILQGHQAWRPSWMLKLSGTDHKHFLTTQNSPIAPT